MNVSKILLCADDQSLQHPEMLGLAGESLAAQQWLTLFSSAEAARDFLKTNNDIDEVWVVSSNDIDAINAAAAFKRDLCKRKVYLLAFQGTGSLWSRVKAAGIDAALSHQAFAERYAKEKRRRSLPNDLQFAGQRESDGALTEDKGMSVSKNGALLSHLNVPTASRAACLLPIVSGSGGAGKSTVATLAALLAQNMGYKTLLLDFDLQFGDLREMLGEHKALSLDDALTAPGRLARLGCVEGKPALLAAPKRLEQAEAIVKDLPLLLDYLLSQFDVIVANTGANWREEHALLLERSFRALFLVDQRPSSLRACKHAFDVCARCGIATNPFLFVVNRCSKGSLFTSMDVSYAMQGAHAVELRDGGGVVEELMSAGLPLELVASRNDLCASLEQVLMDIFPQSLAGKVAKHAGPQEEPRSLFSRRRTRRKRGVL